ncbi:MAG: hypothetical protein WC508_05045 [Patescibacteria group bacterium]
MTKSGVSEPVIDLFARAKGQKSGIGKGTVSCRRPSKVGKDRQPCTKRRARQFYFATC